MIQRKSVSYLPQRMPYNFKLPNKQDWCKRQMVLL